MVQSVSEYIVCTSTGITEPELQSLKPSDGERWSDEEVDDEAKDRVMNVDLLFNNPENRSF